MAVSYATFERLALEDDLAKWELVDGCLREKPGATTDHRITIMNLTRLLLFALDPAAFLVSTGQTYLIGVSGSVFLPDLVVIPLPVQEATFRIRRRDRGLDRFESALPLVVEVWSPSTGARDAKVKLSEYQRRGDAEIWLIHPYDRTLTAYRRQPDGTYASTVYGEGDGAIAPIALPGVRIDLAAVFA